jgi:sulfite reductase (ferredoxin)
MSYKLPANLAQEIDELEGLINRFRNGELEAAALKARRVPFGCYEQRKDGTYMVRVRATGGAVTPAQLIRLAELAEQYGSAYVHITTRQEFQIHDLALENVVPVLRELLPVGLSSRGGGGNTVRNIVVSPTAGIDVDEVFDPSPYAFALTTRLIAETNSWNLPRKLKIAFSNSPADTSYAQFTDIGFIATLRNGEPGFKVYIAGGFGARSSVGHLLHEFIPADEVYIVAEAVKLFFDQHGNRKNRNAARLRFLWEQLGAERFIELYRIQFEQTAARADAKLEPTPLDDESPKVILAPVKIEDAAYAAWKKRYVRAQRQSGLFSIIVPARLGNISTRDLKNLAEFSSAFGDHALRATFGQNLRFRNIPEEYLGNVYLAVKEITSMTDAPLLLSNSVACTGADTCKLGICLPKGALTAIERVLRKSDADLDSIDEFRLNLSGCPNSCGQHAVADLGFYGQARRNGQIMYPAYAIVAGARTADGEARLAQSIDWISARDLPSFTSDLLALWAAKKSRYASFADFIDTDGKQEIQRIADRHHDVPAFEEDKNYYYDWSASEVFTIVGRGVGECSAGLFDLIGVDLKAIDEQNKRLAADPSISDRQNALYRIVLSASRMLLVTRGIEAPSDDAVFQSFLHHFIGAALISDEHRPIVELARSGGIAELVEQEDAVFALAESVRQLYESMDNSLRFPAEKPTIPGPLVIPSALPVRDYRGVACPMNFVKVKLDLSRMKAGERVRVLLDDGKPIENVPRSVVAEGHMILDQVQEGQHWSIVVEKK